MTRCPYCDERHDDAGAPLVCLRKRLDDCEADRRRLYALTLDYDNVRDSAAIMQALASLARTGESGQRQAQAAVQSLDRLKRALFVMQRDPQSEALARRPDHEPR